MLHLIHRTAAGLCLLLLLPTLACSDGGDINTPTAPDSPSQDTSQNESGNEDSVDPNPAGEDSVVCDLLSPIRTTPPSTTLFEPVTHPRYPERSDELTGPIPTNHFAGNLFMSEGDQPVFAHPYVLKMNRDGPHGLRISHSDSPITGGQGSNGAVQYYFNVFENDMEFSMTDSIATETITEIDEFSFHLQLTGPTLGTLTFPIVRGMAYVTAIYENTTPRISTQHAILSVNDVSIESGETSGTVFEIELNQGDRWMLFSVNDVPISFQIENQSLTATDPFHGTLRLAKLPNHLDSERTLLKKHKNAIVIGGTLSAAMHTQENKGASYSFTWRVAGNGEEPLHFALPHHRETISSTAEATALELRSTTKGVMRAYVGKRWTMREHSLSTIEWLAPREPSSESWSHIDTKLREEIDQDFNVGQGSYYFAGKSLYKRALLCLLAEHREFESELATCVEKLQSAMAPFVTSNVQHPLKYDTTWGGIVSSAGLDGNAMHDFGNSYYNDHHYHWGYFLQTGAILAKLSPSWGAEHAGWVETLIRDVANPSAEDPHFPLFRNFDWFSGHSWSQGIFPSADGKDEESTSEEIHFHYGLKLWGLATENTRLRDLGSLMVAVASRSINTYFLMRDDNQIHPPEFIPNKVTGIFFENKSDYATWFGSNREYIHGIQMLPVTAMTEHVRYSDFVAEEWPILAGFAPELASGWKSVLYTNYAIIDPAAAFETLKTAPLDDGLTRTWALYWAATRPEVHSVTRPAAPESEEGYKDWLAQDCAD